MPSFLPTRAGPPAVLLVALAALGASRPALASTQTTVRPGLVVGGGYDDNLLFNGTGGDVVGRIGGRIDLKAWERLWSVSLDLGVSLYGFRERQKIVPLGETTFDVHGELGRWDVLSARLRARGSDDPLGLAQIGLLGTAGSVIGYHSFAEYEHSFDARWSFATRAVADGIQFLDDPFTDRSGAAPGLSLQPRFRITRDLTLQVAGTGRVFLSHGFEGYALDLLPGVRYRVARRFYAELDVGPQLFHDAQGFVPLPAIRFVGEYDERNLGVRLIASQDLSVPNGRAGVLLMDLVEGMVRWANYDWELRGRAGYYRSLSSPRASDWQPGYGFEADAYRRLVSFVWLGVTGMRFERVGTAQQAGMARDAIFLQLDLTQGRP